MIYVWIILPVWGGLPAGSARTPAAAQGETEKCQFITERCQFITEKCQFITEKWCSLARQLCRHRPQRGWVDQPERVVRRRYRLTRPFRAVCLPLNHSGSPGVNGESYRGLCQLETLGVGSSRGGGRWGRPRRQSPRTFRRRRVGSTPCYSVGSNCAREKRKSDQTGLVPILNIWVIIVEG